MPCLTERIRSRLLVVALVCLIGGLAHGQEGRTIAAWGNIADRNMALKGENLPAELTEENMLWTHKVRLGHVYSQPAVVDGKLLVGVSSRLTLPGKTEPATYNHSQVRCYDLESGELLWRQALGYNRYGVVSSFAIDGDRVYCVDQDRLLCLDLDGLADGNDGMQDELELMKRRWTHRGAIEPVGLPAEPNGDILWVLDMDVSVQDAGCGTPLIIGDQVWVTTSQDQGIRPAQAQMKHRPEKMPPPRPDIRIPNIMVVDNRTGKLIAMDDQAIPEVFHGQWSSLAGGVVEGKRLVFWGDGYGILHAYATDEFVPGPDGVQRLKELWQFDANPHGYRYLPDGTRRLYPVTMETNLELRKTGPAHMISTPVFHEGKVYVALGRDRNYADKSRGRGDGPGAISCVDPSDPADADKDRLIWRNTEVGRFHATPAIVDGRMYLAGTDGMLYCMRIDDGQVVWSYDLGRGVCDRSSIVADGKIYVANDSGEVFVFATGDEAKLLFKTRFRDAPSTPMVCGDLLILANKRAISVYKKGAGPARVLESEDEDDE